MTKIYNIYILYNISNKIYIIQYNTVQYKWLLRDCSGHYIVRLHSISFIWEVSCPKMTRNNNIVSKGCRLFPVWDIILTDPFWSSTGRMYLIPEIYFSRDKSEKVQGFYSSHTQLYRI